MRWRCGGTMSDGNRSTEALVTVPALQSLISGLAGAAMFGVMAAAAQLMLGGETDWRFLVLGGLAVGVAGFLVMWVLLMLAHWPRRERAVEMRQAAPMPPSERIIPVFTQRVNPETLKENARQLRFAAFLRACERSTASRHLYREFAPSEVEDFRGVLFTLGVADWNGAEPRQGWRLLMTAQEIAARLRIRL